MTGGQRMSTYIEFEKWLDKLLLNESFENVIAFSFNLYEGIGTFHMQLIGADEFDLDDEDWVCEEVFTSGEDIFVVDRQESGEEWQSGLQFMTNLVQQYLDMSNNARILHDKTAVAIGFVDGDIDILYQNQD